MSKRRKFSPEFKREVVELASQPGVTLREVARDVGIGEGMLGRWRREFTEAGGKRFSGTVMPGMRKWSDSSAS
ncbi:MAG: transposase [Gammaproteobacteria bacterium]